MSSSDRLVRLVAEAAKHYGTRIHIHLGEHLAEVQTCLTRWGLRPPAFYDKYGALGENVLAAHCIRITDFDIRLMAERGLHVVHCPTANLPTQDVPHLLAERAAGLNIALGNDGAHAARQDIIIQMQLLKYVTQPLQGTPVFEPNVLPLLEGFDMMTLNGARALGVADRLGSLEAGKEADIVLLNLNDITYLPTRNLIKTVLMTATSHSITEVMIAGEWMMRDRTLTALDEEKILADGKKQLEDMLRRSK
jgi:5-methylthioadenosine/S-adenosylhomocysteine deaminase